MLSEVAVGGSHKRWRSRQALVQTWNGVAGRVAALKGHAFRRAGKATRQRRLQPL